MYLIPVFVTKIWIISFELFRIPKPRIPNFTQEKIFRIPDPDFPDMVQEEEAPAVNALVFSLSTISSSV